MACSRYQYVDVGGLCKDCEVICPEQDSSWNLCVRDCKDYYRLLHESSSPAVVLEPTTIAPDTVNRQLAIGLPVTVLVLAVILIISIISARKYQQRAVRGRADDAGTPTSVEDTAEHQQQLLGGQATFSASTSASVPPSKPGPVPPSVLVPVPSDVPVCVSEAAVNPSDRKFAGPLAADVYDHDPVSYVTVSNQPEGAMGNDVSEPPAPQASRGVHETGGRPDNLQTALLGESTLCGSPEQQILPSDSVIGDNLAAVSPAGHIAHRVPEQDQMYPLPPPCRESDHTDRLNSQGSLPKDVHHPEQDERTSELSLLLHGPASGGDLGREESSDSESSPDDSELTNLRLQLNMPSSGRASATLNNDTLLTPTMEFTLASDVLPSSDVSQGTVGLSALNVRVQPKTHES